MLDPIQSALTSPEEVPVPKAKVSREELAESVRNTAALLRDFMAESGHDILPELSGLEPGDLMIVAKIEFYTSEGLKSTVKGNFPLPQILTASMRPESLRNFENACFYGLQRPMTNKFLQLTNEVVAAEENDQATPVSTASAGVLMPPMLHAAPVGQVL